MRKQLHTYLGGLSNDLGYRSVIVGGIEDHVHLLAQVCRTKPLSIWVRDLKRNSNGWLRQQDACFNDFAWQAGYGIFSVSVSQIVDVKRYIANQESHHEKEDFKTEFRRLLSANAVDWDERFVWS